MTTPLPEDANRPEASENAEDIRLVKEVLQLDERALSDFTRRVESVPRLLAARNARMGHPMPRQELADLTQDILVLVWKKLPSFQGNSSLETWFYRICSLELMNGLRKTRRRTDRFGPSIEGTAEEPRTSVTESPETRLDFKELHASLDRLEPLEAAVVRLRHFEDLDFAAIAERLGVGVSLAKARYYRALKTLRRLLRNDWDPGSSL